MLNKFFDNINPRFFSVFSRKNKDLYVECLIQMHHAVLNQGDIHLPKDTAYAIIGNVISIFKEEAAITDETDEDTGELTTPSQAGIIQYLVKAGWLRKDYSDRLGDEIILFTSNASIMINAFIQMQSNDMVSTGDHWASVVTALKNMMSGTNPYSSLTQAYQESRNLMSEYSHIDEVVRGIYDELQDASGTSSVLDNIQKMNDEFLHGRIGKIRQESLNPLNVEMISKLIEDVRYSNAVRKKFVDSVVLMTGKTEDEAEEMIDNRLNEIYTQICENSENKISALQELIRKYYETAVRRVQMAFVSNEDISGIINHIISYLRDEDDGTVLNMLPDISVAPPYKGLYAPRAYGAGEQDPVPEIEESTPAFKRRKYEKKQAVQAMMKLLLGKKEIGDEDIPKETEEEFLQFIYMTALGITDKDVPYITEIGDRQKTEGRFTYPELRIRRKKAAGTKEGQT